MGLEWSEHEISSLGVQVILRGVALYFHALQFLTASVTETIELRAGAAGFNLPNWGQTAKSTPVPQERTLNHSVRRTVVFEVAQVALPRGGCGLRES